MAADMQGSVNGFSPAPYNDSFAQRADQPSQASPRPGQMRQFGSPPGQSRVPVFGVYVQNIPLEKTREDLQFLFGKCGDIRSVRILPPKEGYNRCVGFIDFATAEQASTAVEQMNNVSLDETHVLRVVKARERGEQGSRGTGGREEQRVFPPSGAGRRPGGGTQEQDLVNVNGPGRGGNLNGNAFQPRQPGPNQIQQNNFGGNGYQKGEDFNSPHGTQRGADNRPQHGGYQPQSYQQPGNFTYHAPGQGYNMPGQFNSHGGYEQQRMANTAPVNSYQHQGQFDRVGGRGGYNEQGNFGSFDGQGLQGQANAPRQQFDANGVPSGPPHQGGYQEQAYPPSQGNFNSTPGYGSYQGGQYSTGPVQGYQEQGQMNSVAGLEGFHTPGGFNSPPVQGYQEQGQVNPSGSQDGFHNPGNFSSVPMQGYQEQDQVNQAGGQDGFHNPGQGYHSQPQEMPGPGPNMGPGYGGYQQEGINQAPEQFHDQHGQLSGYGGYSEPHSQGGSYVQQGQVNGDQYPQYPDSSTVQNQTDTNSAGYGGREGMFLSQASGRLPRGASNSHSPGSQGNRACHNCGEQGHFSRECPNKSSGDDRACHNCGEQGHFSRECPKRGSGGDRACHSCGEQGHFSRECPNKGSVDRTCRRCGEEGHFARECPALGGTGDRACFNCGQTGHFSRECPNPSSGDEKRPAPVTYVPPEVDDVDTLFKDVHHSGINFDKYDHIPVQVTGKNPPAAISMFDEAGLLEQCTANVRRANYTKPTPIQKHSIPIILSGRDLMACAQTGSGKTAAFLLPVMTSMIRKNQLSGGGLMVGDTIFPSALCIAPTRELAVQISIEAHKFSDGTVIKSSVCYGGVSVQHQLDLLRRGCHFLVATPGRLEDFINRNKISLENVKYLILDEADRMLDMGFEPVIRNIVQKCGLPPKSERQTLMFSATFPDEIQRLAADFLNEDYLFVAVGRVGGTNHDITQTVVSLQGDDKRDTLFDILRNSGSDRTLVFVELKRSADFLACLLSQNNFPTTSISGDRSQYEREAALRDFRTGRAPVLVATSVAARGLDIPDVKHVINYDLPKEIDEYVHRIGRTGRIGNKGKATSFFEQGRDEKLARSLVKVLSEACQEVPDWLESCAESAIGTAYGPAGGRFASRDHRERREDRPRNDVTAVAEGVSSMHVHDSSPAPRRPRAGPGYSALQEDEESWD